LLHLLPAKQLNRFCHLTSKIHFFCFSSTFTGRLDSLSAAADVVKLSNRWGACFLNYNLSRYLLFYLQKIVRGLQSSFNLSLSLSFSHSLSLSLSQSINPYF
jgi:hypothetical protein